MGSRRGYAVLRRFAALAVVCVFLVSAGVAIDHSVQAAGKTLSLIIDAQADRADEAEIIAAYLREIGVEAEVRLCVWSALR